MTHVDWHPYPETSPDQKDDYRDFLLTIDAGYGPFITIDQWLSVGCWDRFLDKDVIAWAELPEPYKPEDKE